MTSYRLKAYLLLIIVAIIWGVATPVIKFTLGGIGPLPFLTYRFALSTIFAIIFIAFARPTFTRIKNNFLEVLIYSVITTSFALGILFIGIERTTVLDTALITAVGPLVTATAGVVFLNERITNQEKLGISLAFLGTLVTVFEPIFKGQVAITQISGNFLVVAYIIIMAFSSVLSKRLVRKDVDPFLLTNVSFVIGFLTLTPLALFQTSPGELISIVSNLNFEFHLGVIYMALLSGTLAYALWVKGQKSIEISEAGVFAYLAPVFAIPLAVSWLGETITFPLIVGAILITIGVSIAEYKRRIK